MYAGLLEGVGVAHVIHGFVRRQPAYIKMGLGLVQQLPSTPDLCVVEGVCYVLLGGVGQAAAALKRAERPGSKAAAGERPAELDVADGALPSSRDAYQFAAFPFFRDTSSPDTAPASLVKYFDDTRVETLLTVYDAKSGGQLAETLSEAYSAIKRFLREASGAAPAPGEEVGAAAELAVANRQRMFRIIAGGGALVAAVVMGLLSPPGQRLLGRGDGAQMAVAAQRAAFQPTTVSAEEFDAVVAKRLLERWQAAKALALGPYRFTDQLDVLLAEPLLSETLDKVATLRSHGAHMRFKLLRLEVLSIKHVNSKAGPTVRVNALLEDTADLHNDSDGKQVNTCRRTYDAEYMVMQGKDGTWRIASTNMVERESRK
ncbi:hypothetical protein GPECTOR_1g663 [Gonium pectorale]|uniref:Plastid division protein CDP1-like IMS domain-containing protein n=1 Tax=Gonium pectorale TaxID=33097 RepID=A0A150H3K2_GONPE|nr:hypothetical protein GPECTOR_1g663 [Gonium pectorale]|eukprot:KXZ56736.1 hypothetical protein GPECTOR_1g663 [Gonium pectorale]